MKNRIFLIAASIIFTINTTAQSNHDNLTSDDVVWIFDTIWEMEYDTKEGKHLPTYCSDVHAKLTFKVKPQDQTKADIQVSIGNYENLHRFSYYKQNKKIPKKVKSFERYEIHLVECHLHQHKVVYYSKNTKEKFVVYLDQEGYMNDAWHFRNFDKDLKVYTTSRYFKAKKY